MAPSGPLRRNATAAASIRCTAGPARLARRADAFVCAPRLFTICLRQGRRGELMIEVAAHNLSQTAFPPVRRGFVRGGGGIRDVPPALHSRALILCIVRSGSSVMVRVNYLAVWPFFSLSEGSPASPGDGERGGRGERGLLRQVTVVFFRFARFRYLRAPGFVCCRTSRCPQHPATERRV